ncbi:MAG: DsrE family protein [Acidiferrobacter sp.]
MTVGPHDPQFSEEFLNAFVDNQIDADEKSRAYPLIDKDEQLNRQVCELRKVSDLVRLAYNEPLLPKRRRKHRRSEVMRRLSPMFAPLVLASGIAIGWLLHTMLPTPPLGPSHTDTRIAATQAVTTKVLFHLDNDNRADMRQVLQEAGTLLARYRAEGRLAKVEVLADGPGLSLLRRHITPFAARIARLQSKYPNLIFAACQDTIDRLTRRTGVTIHLLPQAIIVPSAVAEIVHLQRRGWTYISA